MMVEDDSDDEENYNDIVFAHRQRLMMSPPRQSSFRVLAVIYYELDDDDNEEDEEDDDDDEEEDNDEDDDEDDDDEENYEYEFKCNSLEMTQQQQPKQEEDDEEEEDEFQSRQLSHRRGGKILRHHDGGGDDGGGDCGRKNGPRLRRRHYVMGANDEPCYIGGSICAERAALLQLRFVPNLSRITKVVISTDASHPVLPGLLCREFLSSHPFVDHRRHPTRRRRRRRRIRDCARPKNKPQQDRTKGKGNARRNTQKRDRLRIVSAGSRCVHCQRDLAVQHHHDDDDDENDDTKATNTTTTTTTTKEEEGSPSDDRKGNNQTSLSSSCPARNGNHNDKDNDHKNKRRHSWHHIETNLDEIYPHPSPYTKLSAKESVAEGTKRREYLRDLRRRFCLRQNDDDENGRHVLFLRDDDSSSSVVDSSSSSSSSLPRWLSEPKTVVDLIDRAIEASQEDDRIDLHPIQYGAAVLFDDGTIKSACQKKALEYGSTLDAVTQLAPFLHHRRRRRRRHYHQEEGRSQRRRRRRKEEDETEDEEYRQQQQQQPEGEGEEEGTPPRRHPLLIVQADQFGVIHPPFATARAYLSEHGLGDCHVLVQEEERIREGEDSLYSSASDLSSTAAAVPMAAETETERETETATLKSSISTPSFRLVLVRAKHLAPCSPQWSKPDVNK